MGYRRIRRNYSARDSSADKLIYILLMLVPVALIASSVLETKTNFFLFVVKITLISVGIYFLYRISVVLRRARVLAKIRNIKLGKDNSLYFSELRHCVFKKSYNAAKECAEEDLVNKLVARKLFGHVEELVLKRTQTVYVNEYGALEQRRWKKELRKYVKETLFPIGDTEQEILELERPEYQKLLSVGQKRILDYWSSFVDDYVLNVSPETDVIELSQISNGYDYESRISLLVRSYGWAARVTKGSGDHGADVLAEKEGVRIVFQCKLYSSSVGNRAVQEVYSAKGFYDCDFACVVTNAAFTPAARAAANKLGVTLLHHDQLKSYLAD